MLKARALGPLLVAVLAVAGCTQAATATPTPTISLPATISAAPSPTLVPSPTPSPTVPRPSPTVMPTATTPPTGASPSATPGGIPPEAAALVEEGRDAVAKATGVSASQVKVVSVQRVEWGDPSLGCPEPGMAYAQVITPGYLIRLEAGGKTYEFHADTRGNGVTCPNPKPPASVE